MMPHEPTPWYVTVAEVLNSLVRPVLAFWFGAAVIAFTWFGLLTADAFLGLAGMVIAFFFSARQTEKAEARLSDQQEKLVELAKSVPPPNGQAPHQPP